MDESKILVADADPKNIEILRQSLETSGFNVVIAENGVDVWEKLHSDHPDLILSEVNLPKMDGFQLLERMKDDPQVSSIPLLFLTNRRDIQDRVRSLRGGVKDYMIKPLHVKEVVARIKMILRRMERIRAEEIEASRKLVGRLEEFSVIDLVESFGVERKTGVLAVHNENNRVGEIFFRDGAVVNATLGNFRGEKAVYQMLPWDRGHFTMTFKEVDVPDEVSVSNLGLLLEGFKRIEKREKLLEKLPSPDTRFVMTETFRKVLAKKEVTTDVARFVALFNGRRTVMEIVDESTYEDLKALERIVRLYHQGFIRPVEPEPERLPEAEAAVDEMSSEDAGLEPSTLETPPAPAPEPVAEPIHPFGEPIPPSEAVESTVVEPDEEDQEEEVPEPPVEEGTPSEMFKPTAEVDTPLVDEIEEETATIDLQAPSPEKPVEEISEEAAPVKEPQPAPMVIEPIPIPIELRGIVRKLAQQVGHSRGNLAVLAPEDSGRERFLHQCSGGNFISRRLSAADAQHVEFADLIVTEDIRLEVFGISTDYQFTSLLDTLLPRLLGIVVLLDVAKPELFGYVGYLIRSLYDSYPARFALAITNPTNSEPMSLEYIRAAAGIPDVIPMQFCDLGSTMSIGDILELLLMPEAISPEDEEEGNHQHSTSSEQADRDSI